MTRKQLNMVLMTAALVTYEMTWISLLIFHIFLPSPLNPNDLVVFTACIEDTFFMVPRSFQQFQLLHPKSWQCHTHSCYLPPIPVITKKCLPLLINSCNNYTERWLEIPRIHWQTSARPPDCLFCHVEANNAPASGMKTTSWTSNKTRTDGET